MITEVLEPDATASQRVFVIMETMANPIAGYILTSLFVNKSLKAVNPSRASQHPGKAINI